LPELNQLVKIDVNVRLEGLFLESFEIVVERLVPQITLGQVGWLSAWRLLFCIVKRYLAGMQHAKPASRVCMRVPLRRSAMKPTFLSSQQSDSGTET
jgi:hypothetical protein